MSLLFNIDGGCVPSMPSLTNERGRLCLLLMVKRVRVCYILIRIVVEMAIVVVTSTRKCALHHVDGEGAAICHAVRD